MKGELEKLAFLRGIDADTLDLSVLPVERRRSLAGLGRRLTAQALARREPARRYPILLALIAQSAVDVLDDVLLDGILGNQTDLPVTEHATDTHGATLANFVLFDLVGLQLSPRIRDLGKITLYRTGPRAEFAARYPSACKLLTRRLNEDLITDMWDDLLR